MLIKKISLSILLLISLAVVGRFIYTAIQQNEEFNYHAKIPKTIELASKNFIQNGQIPIEFTGDGKELSPELHWFNLPAGTKSLVVLCTDYDGPTPLLKLLTIDHWVVYNIPVTMNGLWTGMTTKDFGMTEIQGGKNFKGTLDYKGPKPPLGKHRYFFRVYALSDSTLQLTEPTKKEVMQAMKDKILAYGELIGIY
ncbi:YbhB/YbcL family Raf kinase inhibitor-like protein [Cytophaga aurantiaca]|uniref:YbhB/YbcL family Raf kinase inhibitor-like protein n=1 Tax=Cytophaga aurantiaca TaxID=29530 RepID=UPI0003628645|nr:YbhB/YbcL family Raf kinase inhibitor-like protein [Cytophaga aurantiaca]